MKILQSTQMNLATVGVNPNLQPLNLKITIGFLILNLYFICDLVFAIFEAKTFTEYIQSIYMGSCAVLITLALIIIVINMKKLIQAIDDHEILVNTREFGFGL